MSKFALTSKEDIINAVLESEGEGLVENDAGAGVSKWGITKDFHPDLTEDDIRNMTRERAAQIYEQKYWQPIKADEIPDNLRAIAFDTAINMGPGRAQQFLQNANGDFKNFYNQRVNFYQNLINRGEVTRANGNKVNYAQYANGWGNRIGFDFNTNTVKDPWVAQQLGNPNIEFSQEKYNQTVDQAKTQGQRQLGIENIRKANELFMRRANERPGLPALRFQGRQIVTPIPGAGAGASGEAFAVPKAIDTTAADVGVTQRFNVEFQQAVVDEQYYRNNEVTFSEAADLGTRDNFLGRIVTSTAREFYAPEGTVDERFNSFETAKPVIQNILNDINAAADEYEKRVAEGQENGNLLPSKAGPAKFEFSEEELDLIIRKSKNEAQARYYMNELQDQKQREKSYETKSGGGVTRTIASMADVDALVGGAIFAGVKGLTRLSKVGNRVGDVSLKVLNTVSNNRGAITGGLIGTTMLGSSYSYQLVGQKVDPLGVALDGAVMGLSFLSIPKGFNLTNEEIITARNLMRDQPSLTFDQVQKNIIAARKPAVSRVDTPVDYKANNGVMPSAGAMSSLKSTIEIQGAVKNLDDEIVKVEKQAEAIRDTSTAARNILEKLQNGVRDASVLRAARDVINRINPGRLAVRAGDERPVVDTLRGQADLTETRIPRSIVKRGDASLRVASKAIDFEDPIDQVAYVIGKKSENISQVWKDAAVELEKRGVNIKNLTEYGAVLRQYVKPVVSGAPGQNVYFDKDGLRAGLEGMLNEKPWLQKTLDDAFAKNAESAGKVLNYEEIGEAMELLEQQAKAYEDLVSKRKSLGEQRNKTLADNGVVVNENGDVIQDISRKTAVTEDAYNHAVNGYKADAKLQESVRTSVDLKVGKGLTARVINFLSLGDTLKSISERALGLSENAPAFSYYISRLFENDGLEAAVEITAENTRAKRLDKFKGDLFAYKEEMQDMWTERKYGRLKTGVLDVTNTAHNEFNRLIFQRVNYYNRLESQGMPIPERSGLSVDDAIVHDVVMKLAEHNKMILKDANSFKVRGFEDISNFSSFYMRWAVDPDKFTKYMVGKGNEANRTAYVENIAEQVMENYPDIARDKAFQIAKKLFDVQASRAAGKIPMTDFSYHGADFPAEVRQALNDVIEQEAKSGLSDFKNNPVVQELLARTEPDYVKGQLKSTKRRIQRDINSELPGTVGPDGKPLRLSDVMNDDFETNFAIHANNVAGEIGLKSVGVDGKMDLDVIRNVIIHEGGENVLERLELFDRMVAEFLGQPYKGFSPSKGVLALTSISRAGLLGAVGITNTMEMATMAMTAGIADTLMNVPQFAKFIALGKDAMRSGAFDPDLAWEIGVPHLSGYDMGRGLGEMGMDGAVDMTGNNIKRLEYSVGVLSLNRRTTAAYRTTAMNVAMSTLLRDVKKGIKFDGNAWYAGSRMNDKLADELRVYITNVEGVEKFDLQKMPAELKERLTSVINRRYRRMINEPFVGGKTKLINTEFGRFVLTLKNYMVNALNKQMIAAYKTGGGKRLMAEVMANSAVLSVVALPAYMYAVANRYSSATEDKRDQVLEDMLNPVAIAAWIAGYSSSTGTLTEFAKMLLALGFGMDMQGNALPDKKTALLNQLAPAFGGPVTGATNLFNNAAQIGNIIEGEDVRFNNAGIPIASSLPVRTATTAVQNIINENN